MADSPPEPDPDEGAEAWTVPPRRYGEARGPFFTVSPPISHYVTARDGTRIAVDAHVPAGATDPVPAIVMFTPYYRRFALRPGHRSDVEVCPGLAPFRDSFVPQGYALVGVDARGCGASFGSRDGFRSPRERMDYYAVADWIVGQPWSDGTIGATGISFVGAAADFLAGTGHPAVKAVAPLFAVWDTWFNHIYPGGLFFSSLPPRYGAMADALDHDDRELVLTFAYFADPDFAGPAPVDGDPDGALRDAAVAEHWANFDMRDFAPQFPFRDEPLPEDPDYTSAVISPYSYHTPKTDAATACYSISGWFDGGGFAHGATQRFTWQRNPGKRLTLGPWDHGARSNASPFRPGVLPTFDLRSELLRFFDAHLKGEDSGLGDEKPVHYFTMGEERWKAADTWPPPQAVHQAFHLQENGGLSPNVPSVDGADPYKADYARGTGRQTRYERLYPIPADTYYADWHGRDAHMLTYTTPAIDRDTEVTGHVAVTLHLTCSERDCALFAYLEDVGADGHCRYVTEGVFRAIHRKPGPNPENIPDTGPSHSFRRVDARPLVPGEPAEIAFEMFPTSYRFAKGHRIRLAIALADRDHFALIPAGRPPRIQVLRGKATLSRVSLPIVGG